MDNVASWIWVLIPLAAIGIAPFKMWLKIKEKQIVAQTDLAAEKSAQYACLLYTSPSPRDPKTSRMPSSA